MGYVSKIVGKAEDFVWNNLKFYLMSFPTCLLDLLLPIQDKHKDNPFERYKDFPNSLEEHIGLGSYTTGQAAQFSKTPYITVNIQPIPTGGCSARVVMGFDVVYSTDTPKAEDGMTRYIGSSAESVTRFRAEVMSALDELFFYAYGNQEEEYTDLDPGNTVSFMNYLAGREVVNPSNPNQFRLWDYNIDAFVEDTAEISEVSQLKREDRYTGLNVFHVVYKFDINRLWNHHFDCGC